MRSPIWPKTLLLVLVGLFVVPAVQAKDEELTPEQKFERKWEKHRDKLAKEHFKLGGWLKTKKAFKTAHLHYLLTIHFDPNHRTARGRLGYKKIGDSWAPNPRKSVEYDELEDEWRPDVEYREKDDELRKERIEGLLELAEEAQKLGLTDKAAELVRKCVTVDPTSEIARTAAGYKKFLAGWFTEEELKIFPQEVEVARVEGQGDIAKQMGLATEIWRSGRFQVEGTGAPAEFEQYLRSTLCTDAFITSMTTRPTGPADSTHSFFAFDDSDTFGDYLDSQSSISPTDRAFLRNLGAHAGPQWAIVANPLSRGHQDYIAHHLGQRGLWMVGGFNAAWLLAGFTDYVSDRLYGTMICRFVKQESSGGSSGGVNQMTGMMWRRRLQAAVLTDKDAPFQDVFRADIPGLHGIPSMKAWSVFHFLAERDPSKFPEFIRLAKSAEDPVAAATAALNAAYSLTPQTLDIQWREWVIENF